MGGERIILKTGEFPNGELGEISVQVGKEGSTLNAMVNLFCRAVSIGLQNGIPLESFADDFLFTKFFPYGPVYGHEDVKTADSVVDFVFRELAINYLGRSDLSNVRN